MNQQEEHDFNSRIGERIRLARVVRSVNQKELAAKMKTPITYQKIHKYEEGEREVSIFRLCELAEAFDLPINWFLPRSKGQLRPQYYTQEEIKIIDKLRDFSDGKSLVLKMMIREFSK